MADEEEETFPCFDCHVHISAAEFDQVLRSLPYHLFESHHCGQMRWKTYSRFRCLSQYNIDKYLYNNQQDISEVIQAATKVGITGGSPCDIHPYIWGRTTGMSLYFVFIYCRSTWWCFYGLFFLPYLHPVFSFSQRGVVALVGVTEFKDDFSKMLDLSTRYLM